MKTEKGPGKENPEAVQKPEKQGLGETGKEGRRIWYILSEQDREIRI